MIITAWKVSRISDSAIGYVAIAGTAAGQLVGSGVMIFTDVLFRDFLELSDGLSWSYTGIYGAEWKQPQMTAEQPALGGSSWGMVGNDTNGSVWILSDYNYSQAWASGHAVRPYPFTFYNPNPLVITSFTVWNGQWDNTRDWDFRVSNDNASWTTVASGTSTAGNWGIWSEDIDTGGAFRYHQFRIVTGTDRDWENIAEIHIFGTENVIDEPVRTEINTSDLQNFTIIGGNS
jgi:hypothetical protein